MKLSNLEQEAKKYYDTIWSNPTRILQLKKELPSWHFGFYEKGTSTSTEAKTHMMDYVGRLLKLDDTSPLNILDAGSGIGSTSIHLAKKYPHCTFHGITISSYESILAEILQQKHKINNVRFLQGSYMKTPYKENYFDRVFALESIIYSPNKKEFIHEMHRILKPHGKLIILDIFPKKYQSNPLNIKIDNQVYQRKISTKNGKNYYVDIDQFKKFLTSEKFKQISTHNLIKSGNINRFILFTYIILSSFALLITKVRTKHKNKTFTYRSISPFIFFILIMYKLVIGIHSNEYYSIDAVKK
jgi:ubiquinone/menaquinone biosynthesis C-methylase UbiE